MKKQPEPKNCKHILFRIGLQFFRNIPKKQNLPILSGAFSVSIYQNTIFSLIFFIHILYVDFFIDFYNYIMYTDNTRLINRR